MHYVYVLYSQKFSRFYAGESNDLRRRLSEHNSGKNFSTKPYLPWTIVYYEAYPSKRAACDRERKLKHYGKGLSEIKKRIGLDEWIKGAR